jgi:aldehyde dehydrogenase (NAD+)
MKYKIIKGELKMEPSINERVSEMLREHRDFFRTEKTKDINFRLKQLEILRDSIKENERQLIEALHSDLNKSEYEAYSSEIGFCLDSIRYIIKHLRSWARTKKVRTPYFHVGTKSYIYSEPYGTVLIIGPFNYPFQLLIEPLIGAMAAGNCVVLKPSQYTPRVSGLITKMIKENFSQNYIRIVEGGREITSALINKPFDYIFFTGSVNVGKIVMEAAGKNLVPVTLELGGKSPTIVDREANLKAAAQRIAWGKFLNAGQTCVAPDYILAHRDIKEKLISEFKSILKNFYGDDPLHSNDYGRIVNKKQFQRLVQLIDGKKVAVGGRYDEEKLYIEPTILDKVQWDDIIMEDEIFGPILPIIEYESLDDIIKTINDRPKPLALYVFSENSDVAKRVIDEVSFGGGCINDTISHLASPYLPFGGVGTSGIGSYHGKGSFETFSHKKSIMKKTTKFSLAMLYPPYDKRKVNILRKIFK